MIPVDAEDDLGPNTATHWPVARFGYEVPA